MKRSSEIPPHELSAIRRLLVLCLDNVGDLVFCSALFEPLRRRFPDADLDLWCKEYAAGVAGLFPHLGMLFAADPTWDRPAIGGAKGSWWAFRRTRRAVQRREHQLVLVCSRYWRVAREAERCGIPLRVGFRHRRCERWLTHVLGPPGLETPVVKGLGTLLHPLGIDETDLRYRLMQPKPLEEQAQVLGERPGVALHPFAGDPGRCVALGEWISFAAELEARGLGLVWVGTPGELSTLRGQRGWRESWRTVQDFGAPGLFGTCQVISGCRLFVGHDSGPLHVASALGLPCLALFCPGAPKRTFPQGMGVHRLLYRPDPAEVSAGLMLDEFDALLQMLGETPPGIR